MVIFGPFCNRFTKSPRRRSRTNVRNMFIMHRLNITSHHLVTAYRKRLRNGSICARKAREAASALCAPFATRCPKKAKSCRNAHKTGAAGATAQLGLPGPLRGRNPFQNRVVPALVCTFSPANTLATPVSLRLTADAIMQDLAPVAPNRLLTPWLVVGCC